MTAGPAQAGGTYGQRPGWRRRIPLVAIMVTSTLIGTTLSFSYPLLSIVLERHGVPAGLIGLNAALSGLAVFLFAPWLPRLINRFGPVRSILAGQALAVLCLLAFPLEIDLILWSLLRFALGAGVAIAWIASEAAVNALAEERWRARIMALYATLFCVGYALGPMLIGVTGSDGTIPFLVAALLVAAGAPPLLLAGDADRAMTTGAGTSDLPRIIRFAPFALAAILAFGLVETTLFALFPLYGIGLGHDEATAAFLLSVLIAGNVVFQVPIGWLADRFSRSGTLLGCALVGCATMLLWPWTAASVVWSLPALAISGGAIGGLYSLSLTLLGERFHGGDLAAANTAFVVTYQIGAMVGPPLVGLAMEVAGPASLPYALALLLGAFLAASGRLRAA